MKVNSLGLALALALLASGACAGAEASAPASAAPQVSMTRMMVVFSGIERELAAAVAAQDSAATTRLVSGDFEYRAGAHPGEPTSREDWLADEGAQGSGTDQLSVRELGDVAVASFVMSGNSGADCYVVDVWKRQGEDWQLVTRYQAELPNTEESSGDIAPTGKG